MEATYTKAYVHYVGLLQEDRTPFDSSRDRDEPFCFEIGQQMVIRGFEEAVKSLQVGERKEFVINVEDAYGPINPSLIGSIKRELLPQEIELSIGLLLDIKGYPVAVREIGEDYVILDANHHLAGKVLIFDIELLKTE